MVATLDRLQDKFILDVQGGSLTLEQPFLNQENNIEFKYCRELDGKIRRIWANTSSKRLVIPTLNKKLITCRLSDSSTQFWNEISVFHNEIYQILKGYSERLEQKAEWVTGYVKDERIQMFIPETMVNYGRYSTKFENGFTYYMNKHLNTKFTYEELQKKMIEVYKTQKVNGEKETLRLSVASIVLKLQ